MRDNQALFWEYDWNRVAEGQKVAANRDVESYIGTTFSGNSMEELADQLCDKYSLTVPELDLENISVKRWEVQIDVSNDRMRYFSGDGPHHRPGTAIDVRIPFSGDKDMFKIKPNTWTTSIPRGRVEGNSVVFTISGTKLAAPIWSKSRSKPRSTEGLLN